MYRFLRTVLSLPFLTGFLHAAQPDISNLNQCIDEVRSASINPPNVPTFDPYIDDYTTLLVDLQAALPNLPHVYQEAAAKPLISFLQNLGAERYREIFTSEAPDEQTDTLQQLIPDAALSVLLYDTTISQGVNAFEEIMSDLYGSFLSDDNRIRQQGETPIDPPTYGSIPPLVKFGNQKAGPYIWPADATSIVLGMGCGIVSLPPSQLQGGLLAWSFLGPEAGGHDVSHADQGLLDELAHKVYAAVLQNFGSKALANYWASCIDEMTADVCGYLNLGPSLGFALIGYLKALGNGKLRTGVSTDDPHPIDLLRGYLGAAVVKHLSFKDAAAWSQMITDEVKKDDATLFFVDPDGNFHRFPVFFNVAVASADVVAKALMESKLNTLQGHSLQELEDWKDEDQALVDQVVTLLTCNSIRPIELEGQGFCAAYVVAAATQAGLQKGADLELLFIQMQSFLSRMHLQDPTWSSTPTEQSVALLERSWKGSASHEGKHIVRHEIPEPEHLAHQNKEIGEHI